MIYCLLLVGVSVCVTRAYNIEEKQVHPIYLRNGGSAVEYDLSQPAYAGYTFDAILRGDNMRWENFSAAEYRLNVIIPISREVII